MIKTLVDEDIQVGFGPDHVLWLTLMKGRLYQSDRQVAINSLRALQISTREHDLVASFQQELDEPLIASQMPQPRAAFPGE